MGQNRVSNRCNVVVVVVVFDIDVVVVFVVVVVSVVVVVDCMNLHLKFGQNRVSHG